MKSIGLFVLMIGVGAVQDGAVPAPVETAWTMEDLLPAVAELRGRDWISGGRVFEEAGCGICHAMSTYWEGSGLAPDLTGVASKMSREEILRSIVEPSATLNGQYYHTEFTLEDGTIVSGTVVGALGDTLIVAPVMMVPDQTIRIARGDILSERPAPASPMPAGLLNAFSRDQVLDLIAFLEAGADPDAAGYAK